MGVVRCTLSLFLEKLAGEAVGRDPVFYGTLLLSYMGICGDGDIYPIVVKTSQQEQATVYTTPL